MRHRWTMIRWTMAGQSGCNPKWTTTRRSYWASEHALPPPPITLELEAVFQKVAGHFHSWEHFHAIPLAIQLGSLYCGKAFKKEVSLVSGPGTRMPE